MKNNLKKILTEIEVVLSDTEEKEVKKLIKAILKAEKIITIGAGRVGMMARGFAMRLIQLPILLYRP
ncbi:MAG: Hexulose-6-phosphate isomerase [Candidatus Daviesbacteria bacterium GW2011_GWF2_38_6]|uniref:Hexulose-6-phosphate isomerase n=1 Tax=Candidatus Daviesbacteria bacterium GW2011_GWF2_38_6 TaxID=1618432 RepID=A0A0G0KBX7_9BACT|nr:MAG: Hexulose-6-phosphate isomerase [Candidatus Daviesbacteria bacterium GW2011_GWF2_38_6]